MAIRQIRTVPDPVLRQKARRVKTIDAALKKLIADMFETCAEASGVGLAAPQVGIPLRLIVLMIPKKDEKEERYCLINPEIIKRKGERVVKEGCLSIPGYFAEIKRSEGIRIKGMDAAGKEIKLSADGLMAQALEHEIDHLNGILYVDHLETQDQLKRVEPETTTTALESEPGSTDLGKGSKQPPLRQI